MHPILLSRRAALRLVLFGGLALALPLSAWAHGPTVKLRYGSVKPLVLTIQAGQTVHFQNENSSGLPCTVVFAGGELTGPTLEKGGGWHHTFEEAGEFPYQLAESSKTRGTIVVEEAP